MRYQAALRPDSVNYPTTIPRKAMPDYSRRLLLVVEHTAPRLVMRDYVEHLEHHLHQVLGPEPLA